jgi:hypothetical protein
MWRCWDWFWVLNNKRTSGFDGENPITYTEMIAFFQLFKLQPLEWEISMIDRFDVVYLNHKRSKSAT